MKRKKPHSDIPNLKELSGGETSTIRKSDVSLQSLVDLITGKPIPKTKAELRKERKLKKRKDKAERKFRKYLFRFLDKQDCYIIKYTKGNYLKHRMICKLWNLQMDDKIQIRKTKYGIFIKKI